MKILTFGVYDLLHLGHILLMKHARALGTHLTVAVQDGDSVLKYKPDTMLVNGTAERIAMVAAIRYVDEVVVYSDVDKDIENIDFDILAKGPDQVHAGFARAVDWCRAHGKEVVTIPRTEGISSSMLKELAAANKIK